MLLAGLQPLSILDYPGQIACIVFTQGCNFRCPFCHNADLIRTYKPEQRPDLGDIRVDQFFDFLERRRGKLDGVVVTGGEPTLHPDLLDFLKRIKSIGFLLKLDSNGSNPNVLEQVIQSGMVDYYAMDIKSSPFNYSLAMGRKADIERISRSIDLIMHSGKDYEFRTTVVPGIHQLSDFSKIGDWIKGARHYYIQEYQSEVNLDPRLKYEAAKHELSLDEIREIMLPFVEKVIIRR